MACVGGSLSPLPQHRFDVEASLLKSAPKLFKDNTRINWNQDGQTVCNFVRGLSPFPAAWSTMVPVGISDELPLMVKVLEAAFLPATHALEPGTLVTDQKTSVWVTVRDGYVSLLRLQSAGRKLMNVADWLRGFHGIMGWNFEGLSRSS